MPSIFDTLFAFSAVLIHSSSGAAIHGRDWRRAHSTAHHHHSHDYEPTSTFNGSAVATSISYPSGTGVIGTFTENLVGGGSSTASLIPTSAGDDDDDDDTATSSSSLPAVSSSSFPSITITSSSGTSQTTPTSSNALASAVPSASSTSSSSYWKPAAGTQWQIQLTGTLTDVSYAAEVYDIDLFDNDATAIANLKSNDKKVICYFSAGSYEQWRPDVASFQASDKGLAMEGWEGEWWLNTNSANVRTIMTARIELAQTKGCDGVDPDNVDAYDNDNGAGLTQDDAVNYLTFLADAAHSRGISIGLKNAGKLVEATLPIMEWQVNEQCVENKECDDFQPFITAGKPVFHIEYPAGAPNNITADDKSKDCGVAGFSSLLKDLDLDAWVDPCE
ncbi:hypothetical protein LAWI1_G006574 [Lachnellula willkommii]|uniref:alpha-galactosidase n=1 Tax=Lachnellula willkommii TaxID=215461 RepID=A0A559M864_9HELO|nr:hypothetical protein LAWI1_G006574 [Lachnellula willkommii]